jgi:integrase
MQFHSLTNYSSLMVTDKEEKIKGYVLHLRSKQASKTQFVQLFATLKNFYEMNDVEDIKWRKLKRFIGEEVPEHEDRRYTHEEILVLVKNTELKLATAILLMSSSGVRIGSLPNLLVGHLEKKGDLYKVNVYKGLKGKGQYYTFCTPECAKAIDSYLDFRQRCGEKITPNSPLCRKNFDTDFPEKARNDVQPWRLDAINELLRKALIHNGLITIDHVNPSGNRKEVKMSHGFRKFFKSQLVLSKVDSDLRMLLMGHSKKGLELRYDRLTEEEMLSEYEKAIDNLTIDPANRLLKKVEKLEVEASQLQRLQAAVTALEQKIK